MSAWQMVLTAALGSMRRCCNTLASSQRLETHRRDSSHNSLPRTLARAHTPPTAPTQPGDKDQSTEFPYGLFIRDMFRLKHVLDPLTYSAEQLRANMNYLLTHTVKLTTDFQDFVKVKLKSNFVRCMIYKVTCS